MSEQTAGVNYFQYLPGSASARSGGAAAGIAQTPPPASNGLPQGQPQEATAQQYTPEQIQGFIRAAEVAQQRAQNAERQAQHLSQRQAVSEQQQAFNDFEALRARAREEASQMGFDDALAHMENFERRATESLMGSSHQMFTQFASGVFAENIMRDYGLPPEDRILLGNDPNIMPQIAERLKANRDAIEQRQAGMEERIEQQAGQQYVQQRIEQGAYAGGGDAGRQPAVDPSKLSEVEGLRYALSLGR